MRALTNLSYGDRPGLAGENLIELVDATLHTQAVTLKGRNMNSVEIFHPKNNELHAGFPLIKNLYSGFFNDGITEEEYLSELDKAFSDPKFSLLFVRKDSKVVGLLAAREVHYVFYGQGLWIHSVYVLPEYRRSGIGGALFNSLKEIGNSRGIKSILFNAASAELNPDYGGLDTFYSRMGCTPIGKTWMNIL